VIYKSIEGTAEPHPPDYGEPHGWQGDCFIRTAFTMDEDSPEMDTSAERQSPHAQIRISLLKISGILLLRVIGIFISIQISLIFFLPVMPRGTIRSPGRNVRTVQGKGAFAVSMYEVVSGVSSILSGGRETEISRIELSHS
jgi:hypothetical protein